MFQHIGELHERNAYVQAMSGFWKRMQVFFEKACVCSSGLECCCNFLYVCRKKLTTNETSEHTPIQDISGHEEEVVFLQQTERRNEQSAEAPDQWSQVTHASLNPAQQCMHCSKARWYCDCVCLLCKGIECSCNCKCSSCEKYVWRCNCSKAPKYIKVKPKDPSPLDIPGFMPMRSFQLRYPEVGVYDDVNAQEWDTWTEVSTFPALLSFTYSRRINFWSIAVALWEETKHIISIFTQL